MSSQVRPPAPPTEVKIEFEFSARFTGGVAEDHRIPAYEGSQSLEGMARSFTLVNHYLITGKVRQRAPYTNEAQVYLRPPQHGCFEAIFLFKLLRDVQAFGGDVAINVTADLLKSGIQRLYARVTGQADPTDSEELDQLEHARPGDFDALADAIEPAVKQGHTTIGNGAQNIIIINGDHNVVHLNSDTKEYVNSEIVAQDETVSDLSVGALNANSGFGRVWMPELGKTVPCKLAKEKTDRTMAAMTKSLDSYANNLPSDISVKYRKVYAPDGRLKRVLIYDAFVPHD